MRRVLGLVVVALLAGCATPPSAGVTVPSFSPLREALAYFPQDAPVVLVATTDGQHPGIRRLAASGALKPLGRLARARGIHYAQVRGLLGGVAVAGQPYVGGPPLAVLPTGDGDQLAALAAARVDTGRAKPAGTYRSAELYAEDGWAFATRGRTLIVSRTTRDLRAALDTRVKPVSFEAAQLNDVLPQEGAPAAFARAYVDVRPLIGDAVARRVPVLDALGVVGVSIGATPEELQATTRIAVDGLTDEDLPALKRPSRAEAAIGWAGGVRPGIPDKRRAIAVADLAPLARAAEKALDEALPVTALKLDALRARLGVDASVLAGPAVVTDRPALRLLPARPAALRAALERAREKGLLAGDITAGFVGDSFVAGRASAADLRRLASLPLSPLRAPALLRIPRLADWYPRPVVVTLGGDARRLELRAYSGF